jgi:hypothetical protein
MAHDAGGGDHLTERQKKWFASVRANLQAKTGRSIEEWVAIARTCPHEKPRARVDWLRETHGLGVNHASFILSEAFESKDPSWSDGPAMRQALWTDPAALKILEAVERAVAERSELVCGQRKGFTAFSRKVQFAAARPLKGGRLRLGLGVAPDLSARLEPAKREGWSERLKAALTLGSPEEVDEEIRQLLKAAWEQG